MSENLKKFLELIASNKELEKKALACNDLGEEKGKLAMIELAKENGIGSLANMIIVGHLLENHPELSFSGVEDVVEKLVPPKKAALKELNMKALSLGKNYNK